MPVLDVNKLRDQGKRFASGFTTGQKAVSIAAVVGVFLAMFVFTKWAGKPQYAPLFTDLDSKAAGEVTQALDSQGINYQLTDGGRTVTVPRDKLYKTRADLSTQNIPQASTDGWSIMDQGGITKSEFSQRIDYQRALQSELAKTVSAIDGVSAATVNLTIPQQSVFVDDQADQSSAAVLVTPVGGTALSSEKVQAIVNLVAGSVPAMKAENVTVADSLGNVLSAPGQQTDFASAQQVEQRSTFESTLAKKMEAMFAASLGPGHAAVNVTADLNFDKQHDETITNKQPNAKGLPKNQITDKETYKGQGSGATGVLGPNGSPLTPSNTTPTDYNHTKTSTEFAVDQVQSTIDRAPGSINKLSVAVLLDNKKVSTADVAKWTQTINAAAGISKQRGDQVAVNLVPFDTTAQKAQEQQQKTADAAKSQDFLLNAIKYIVTLLIVLMVLFFAWRSVKRSAAIMAPVRVPLDLRELEASDLINSRLDAAYERTHQLPDGSRASRALDAPRSAVEEDLTRLIEQQPDEVAQTLRSWLADRRS